MYYESLKNKHFKKIKISYKIKNWLPIKFFDKKSGFLKKNEIVNIYIN